MMEKWLSTVANENKGGQRTGIPGLKNKVVWISIKEQAHLEAGLTGFSH